MTLKKVIYHIKKHVSYNVPIDKDDNCDCLKGTEFVINIIFSMKCFDFLLLLFWLLSIPFRSMFYHITGEVLQACVTWTDHTDRHVEGGESGLLPVQGQLEVVVTPEKVMLIKLIRKKQILKNTQK